MYTVNVSVQGTAPLLQHRFPMPDPGDSAKGATLKSGSPDYTQEWRSYFYATADGEIYQPSTHFEGALVGAAVNYKIQGRRGKTYKDLFRAAVFVSPEQIKFGINVPDELTTDADQPLYIDMRPVVVNRARVVRSRPAFKPGWQLEFEIEVLDDQIHPELLHDILTMAGKTVGVGDNRPKFGRFMVTEFKVNQ